MISMGMPEEKGGNRTRVEILVFYLDHQLRS
jgi:hypothetical protein